MESKLFIEWTDYSQTVCMALQQIQMQAASWEMHWLILRLHLLVTPQGLVFTPSMPVLYYTVPATNYNTTICNSSVFQLEDITQHVASWHWFLIITSTSVRIVLIWLKRNVMNWFIQICAMDKKNDLLYPAHMDTISLHTEFYTILSTHQDVRSNRGWYHWQPAHLWMLFIL